LYFIFCNNSNFLKILIRAFFPIYRVLIFPIFKILPSMLKFIYTTAAIAALFCANMATSQAQSALNFALASATHLNNPAPVASAKPAVYTTSPMQIIEFVDDECMLVVSDMDGEKILKTIVMDGKMTVPAEMNGVVSLLDISSQSGHQTFEVVVREDADYAENY
jgi:hypothetical protein